MSEIHKVSVSDSETLAYLLKECNESLFNISKMLSSDSKQHLSNHRHSASNSLLKCEEDLEKERLDDNWREALMKEKLVLESQMKSTESDLNSLKIKCVSFESELQRIRQQIQETNQSIREKDEFIQLLEENYLKLRSKGTTFNSKGTSKTDFF